MRRTRGRKKVPNPKRPIATRLREEGSGSGTKAPLKSSLDARYRAYNPCMRSALFAITDQGIAQTVLERTEPGLIVTPLNEAVAENRLADLL